jgi:hypothetical protein
MNRLLSRLGFATAAVAIAACGSSQIPTTRVASTAAAVRSAHEVGSDAIPEAALHTRMAEDEMRAAQRLIREDKPEQADLLLARSQSDAELAIGLTRAAKAKAQADAATAKLQSIGQGIAPQGAPVPVVPQQ